MVEVGDDAPDFELLDQNRNAVTGAEHRGRRVVLAFFPAAFTGVCKQEMCSFQASLARLNDANVEVLGVSVDGPFANLAFADANGLEFRILSDHQRVMTHAYGVALDDFAGISGYTAAMRSVFIVDENGNVAWKWVADNPGQEPDYDAVLAALDA